MLFFKLIIRSLLRHQKKGKKLIVFLTLCITAIIFCFSMKNSFHNEYVRQITDAYVGHLQIVSNKSSKLDKDNFMDLKSNQMQLINIDSEFDYKIKSIEGVEFATGIIETRGAFFTIDGDFQGESEIVGINSAELFKILPALLLNGGTRDFNYNGKLKDIPLLRIDISNIHEGNHRIFKKETNSLQYEFVRDDFRMNNKKFEEFKKIVKNDFSDILTGNIEGTKGTEYFIKTLNDKIIKRSFYEYIPSKYTEEYNYQIDNLVTSLQLLNENNIKDISKYNKKIFNALYPNEISIFNDEVSLNKPMTLVIEGSREDQRSIVTTALPIKFVGYIKTIPLYSEKSFLDINILKKFLKINNYDFTEYMIRVKNIKDIPRIKKEIQAYIKSKNLTYTVLDYTGLASHILPTILAFDVIFTIIIIIFLISIVFFIINLVLLMIIKRKREFGTSFTLGMSKAENIIVLIGEIFIIVTLSWIIGSITGFLFIMLFSKVGIPGIVFFNTGKLYFSFNITDVFISYLCIIPIAILSAIIPCLSIMKMRPVDILREIN